MCLQLIFFLCCLFQQHYENFLKYIKCKHVHWWFKLSLMLPLLAIQQVDHFQFVAKLMPMMSPFVCPTIISLPPPSALLL